MAKHVLTKLDPKAILEEGERTGQSYPLKASWRRFMRFAGILCCLLVIGLPFGIYIIIAAGKARVALGEEGFVLKIFGSRAWAWKDIDSFTAGTLDGSAMGGGLIGLAVASAVAARTEGMRGPIYFKLKDRRMPLMMPAHQVERSVAMAREMERRSGLQIFPPETAKA